MAIDQELQAILEAELLAERLTGFGTDGDGNLILGVAGVESDSLRSYAESFLEPARLAESSDASLSDRQPVTYGGFLSFFEGEVRPGSAFNRVEGDTPVLPGGTVGLFLSRGGRRGFLAAGHSVSHDWIEGRGEPVHRAQAGTTGLGRRLSLGLVSEISETRASSAGGQHWNRIDAAIVDFESGVRADDDPTCFDEFVSLSEDLYGDVMKCGSQEPIFTRGQILSSNYCTAIVRGGRKYLFRDQLLVRSPRYARPFAKPGDSGTMVVNPAGAVVGMILGGNVLRDEFVVSRIDFLHDFWASKGYSTPLKVSASGAFSQLQTEAPADEVPAARRLRRW